MTIHYKKICCKKSVFYLLQLKFYMQTGNVVNFCLFRQLMSKNALKYDVLLIRFMFKHLFSLNTNNCGNFKVSRKRSNYLAASGMGTQLKETANLLQFLPACKTPSPTEKRKRNPKKICYTRFQNNVCIFELNIQKTYLYVHFATNQTMKLCYLKK